MFMTGVVVEAKMSLGSKKISVKNQYSEELK